MNGRNNPVALLMLCATPLAAQVFDDLAAKANAAREADRLEEATVLYRKALELQPAWAEGWWSLGTILYDRDDYPGAARALNKAFELDPKSGNAAAMLGLSEAKLGRDADALRDLEKAIQLGVTDDAGLRPVMLYTMGTLQLAAGEFSKAQDALDLLVRDGPQNDDAVAALGQAVLGMRPGDFAAADEVTRDAVRQAGLAERVAARGDADAALAAYRKLAADFPKVHNVEFACGRFLLARHYDQEAVAAFQREIQNSPQHLLARLGIAGALLNTDPESGLPYARQAVALAPGLAEAHYLLGALLLGTGSTEEAIGELETARRHDPGDARIHFALARAYTLAHRIEDAERARAEFLRLNKENPQ